METVLDSFIEEKQIFIGFIKRQCRRQSHPGNAWMESFNYIAFMVILLEKKVSRKKFKPLHILITRMLRSDLFYIFDM